MQTGKIRKVKTGNLSDEILKIAKKKIEFTLNHFIYYPTKSCEDRIEITDLAESLRLKTHK